MSHAIEMEPHGIPNLARIDEVGAGLFNNATRLATVVALGRHYMLDDGYGLSVADIAHATQKSRTATDGQLQVLQDIGLVGFRKPVESPPGGHPRSYRILKAPGLHVIHATMQAVGPVDTIPDFTPRTLGLSEAIHLQKRLFGKRLMPFVGLYLANMSDSSRPIRPSDFTGHRIIGQTTYETVNAVFSSLLGLGMIEATQDSGQDARPAYMPTSSPLLETFQALARLVPTELQPVPA